MSGDVELETMTAPLLDEQHAHVQPDSARRPAASESPTDADKDECDEGTSHSPLHVDVPDGTHPVLATIFNVIQRTVVAGRANFIGSRGSEDGETRVWMHTMACRLPRQTECLRCAFAC
jgi:hypothetical protein